MPSSARSDDRGQSTVELALCLPLVCLLLLGVVQVAVIVRDQLAVQLAAREAARAAAVSGDSSAAAARAAGAGAIEPPVEIGVVESGGAVTVTARAVSRTDLPLIGPLLPDVTVSASATMTLEPP